MSHTTKRPKRGGRVTHYRRSATPPPPLSPVATWENEEEKGKGEEVTTTATLMDEEERDEQELASMLQSVGNNRFFDGDDRAFLAEYMKSYMARKQACQRLRGVLNARQKTLNQFSHVFANHPEISRYFVQKQADLERMIEEAEQEVSSKAKTENEDTAAEWEQAVAAPDHPREQ